MAHCYYLNCLSGAIMVQNSSGQQVIWCRWTAALEEAVCFTAVIWQSRPVQNTVENVFVWQGLGCSTWWLLLSGARYKYSYLLTLKLQSNGPLYSSTVIGTLLLMGGLLHMVQRGGAWMGCGPPSPLLAVPNVTAHPSMPVYQLLKG